MRQLQLVAFGEPSEVIELKTASEPGLGQEDALVSMSDEADPLQLPMMVPLDRYGYIDEVAALVAFITGPESSYINGANLTVDGGTNA